MCEVLSKITLVFADPRSGSHEIIGVDTLDVVEAERDISRNDQTYYGPYYRAASEFLRAAKSPAIRKAVVALIEGLNCDVCLSFIKDNTYTAEVFEKSLQGWYPSIYRAPSGYIRVANLVIIHIDYDYALDVLLYLMVDESDKNVDIRKKNPSLEQQEKLSKILRDIENKNKGMPSSKKMDLLRVAAIMVFTQQEYPYDIHRGIGIVDQIFSFFRGSKPAPKEISTLMSCEKGLLGLLEAPVFKTTERLRVRVENVWLIVKGGGETTTGYKAYDEKVEIAGEHLYDQHEVVAEFNDSELKVLFPFASEKGRIDDSLSVEWEKVDI